MIYCPSCKKPSAKNTGSCPHCGTVFTQGPTTPGIATPAAPTEPAGHHPLRYGGADITMDIGTEDDDGPLELDTDTIGSPASQRRFASSPQSRQMIPPQHSAAPPSSCAGTPGRGTSLAETHETAPIDQIAQFGKCESGIWGIMKYGFRVKQRLPGLTTEVEYAKQEKIAAWEHLETAKANLGRAAHREKLDDPKLIRMIDKAAKADNRLESVQREEDKLNLEYEKKYSVFGAAMAKIDAELSPLKIAELKMQGTFDAVKKEKARLSAKIKRTEIELRNCSDRIMQRQTGYADLQKPKEERARLLKEISQIDHEQIPLQTRLQEEQKELAAVEEPFRNAQHQLTEIHSQMAIHNEKMVNLKKQRAAVQKEHEIAIAGIHGKAQGESKQAQQAWAAVGELVFVNRLYKEDATIMAAKDVEIQTSIFFTAQEKASLYTAALDSYNKSAFEQAKKYWMIAAVLAGILLILLIAAVIF